MSSKRILIVTAAATLAAAVTGIALGSPPFAGIGTPPVRGTIDGSFKLKSDVIKLKTKGSIDVVTQKLHATAGRPQRLARAPRVPSSSSSNRGVHVVRLRRRELHPHVYSAGEAFVDTGDGHIARNEGAVPAEVTFTFLLPQGGGLRTELPDPGTCPFSG